MYDVVICGAGGGGLSGAVFLARGGASVAVVEKASYVGGLCSTMEHAGYRFERGAVFVLSPEIYRRVYAELGLDFDQRLTLLPIDPVKKFRFDDGTELTLHPSLEQTEASIARLSPPDARRLRRFWNQMVELGKVFEPMIIGGQTWTATMGNPTVLRHAFWFLRKMGPIIDASFRDDRVKAAMLSPLLYIGLAPAEAWGPLAAVPVIEMSSGLYHPKGGMGQITKDLAEAFEGLGGELRLNSSVKRILLEGRRAAGVILDTGEEIRSRAVLSNIDAIATYLDLIGAERLPDPFVGRLQRYKRNITGMTVKLGVDMTSAVKDHLRSTGQEFMG